jgi:hypothetical protein
MRATSQQHQSRRYNRSIQTLTSPHQHQNRTIVASGGRASRKASTRCLESLFGIRLSRGGSVHTVLRAARRCEPVYETIPQNVAQADWVVPDETGWRVGGQPDWLHTLAGPQATAYVIDLARGGAKPIRETWQPLEVLIRRRVAMTQEGLVRGQLWLTRMGHVRPGEAPVWVEGWRKWAPPGILVKEWSRRFADLRFYLTYNVEGLWDAGVYEFVNGDFGLLDHHVGWFRMARDGEPVHHYVVHFEDDDPADRVKFNRLADAKRVFRPHDTA